MAFDTRWEEIHGTRSWGQYPSEAVIRFVARNYYAGDRSKTKILDFGCGGVPIHGILQGKDLIHMHLMDLVVR